MAVQADDSVDADFAKGYAECIAQAANAWAYLEHNINECIWGLADTAPALGACLTAQIINLNARLSALLALMKHRKVSDALIARVNKFAENARGPNELRNRIVHDAWMAIASEPDAMGQLRVTAAKKLDFAIRDVPLETLEKNVRTILKCRNESTKIRDALFAELPTLPEIPHSGLHPITSRRAAP